MEEGKGTGKEEKINDVHKILDNPHNQVRIFTLQNYSSLTLGSCPAFRVQRLLLSKALKVDSPTH